MRSSGNLSAGHQTANRSSETRENAVSEGKTQNADIGVDRLLRDGLVLLLPVLVLFGYVLVRPQLLADGDTGWHVATGQWMLSHRQVPK
ncbi:MAG: hypothetical protein CMN69_10335, partial [Sphingomonadaceae bacterium]|nr:hypothetical protein [Sphingomonadaceae bacterium]